MAMDTNYVLNRAETLKNFKTLISYRISTNTNQQKYYADKLKNGKTFIVEIIDNKIEFAPSKFLGYKNNTMEIHEQKHHKNRSGQLTDINFEMFYGKRLYFDDYLDIVLDSFYNHHGIDGTPYKKKARLHYFILPETLNRVKKIFREIPEFFLPEDIEKYSSYAGKPYRKENPMDVKVGEDIRKLLYDKTNYWLNSVSVPKYLKESNTRWQIMGRFAYYTWGRIFKENDKQKLIYFTVGIDLPKKALIYKLDCQRERPAGREKLSKEQVAKFDNFVCGSGAEWVQIDLQEIDNLNWNILIHRTNEFISKYDQLYDNVIMYVWGIGNIKQPKNSLEEVDPPDPQVLPALTPSFIPKKINFTKMHKTSSKIGIAGELLVLEKEKQRLRDKLKPGMKIEHISKEKGDGAGYDIKSFDEEGNEIYIEVKTTTSSNKEAPFYLTPTEIEFSKIKKKSYWLYVIYNFNKKNNSGSVYKINGYLKEILDLRADSYICVFKGK